MDWARVSGDAYLLQKLIIYFALPPGELINDPEVGCCLHEMLFLPLTDSNLAMIRVVMTDELRTQIPELGVQHVEVSATDTKDAIMLKIMGYNQWIFNICREDLIDINLLDVFGGVG